MPGRHSNLLGVEIAGGMNWVGNMRGVQIGVANACDTLHGIQIGLFNFVSKANYMNFCPIFNASF